MKVVYIVGDSRSGSTLLQHLLASQDGVVAAGEIRRLQSLAADGEPCACGQAVGRCPFWAQVGDLLGRQLTTTVTGVDRGSWANRVGQAVEMVASRLRLGRALRVLLRQEHAAATNCVAVQRAVGESTGAKVVVDSSKVPSHFLHLYLTAPDLVVPVFIVRDGRGIVWSKMTRSRIGSHEAVLRWRRTARMILAVRRIVPADRQAFIKYEDLCADPVAVLGDVLQLAGMSVDAATAFAMPAERHDLGGSPRFRDVTSIDMRQDDRWQTEMPAEAQAVFDRLGGALNRRLGYD